MSTHDEESAPLEETQASDEPGELEAGEASAEESFDTASVASEPPPISEEVEHGLLQARAALEQKDWQGIADYLGLGAIYVEGHPEPVSAIVEKLNALTANLCDFEGVMLRVSKHEVDADRARFSFRFRIMWNSCDDWEDHDLYVDAHLGYVRSRDGWKISHLSVNRARVPEEQGTRKASAAKTASGEAGKAAVPAVSSASTAASPRPKRAGASRPPARVTAPPPPPPPLRLPQSADQPLSDEYFSQAAAQYFAQLAATDKPEGADKRLQTTGSSVGGKHHLLYVPVVMHEDLIKKILGND